MHGQTQVIAQLRKYFTNGCAFADDATPLLKTQSVAHVNQWRIGVCRCSERRKPGQSTIEQLQRHCDGSALWRGKQVSDGVVVFHDATVALYFPDR